MKWVLRFAFVVYIYFAEITKIYNRVLSHDKENFLPAHSNTAQIYHYVDLHNITLLHSNTVEPLLTTTSDARPLLL